MRVWVDSGGSDSCCKDGIYDCCLMDEFKCVLGGGGAGASGNGGIVVAVGLGVVTHLYGYPWWVGW